MQTVIITKVLRTLATQLRAWYALISSAQGRPIVTISLGGVSSACMVKGNASYRYDNKSAAMLAYFRSLQNPSNTCDVAFMCH